MIERSDDANAPETTDAANRAGDQGLLFTDDLAPMPEDTGFRGPTACSAAGITSTREEDEEIEKFREFLDEVEPEDFEAP